MEIRQYRKSDETGLLHLMKGEGEEWDYCATPEIWAQYLSALDDCLTYVAIEDGTLCGFSRCRVDGAFGIYVYDLLVGKPYRGKKIGQRLLEQPCHDFPKQTVYVMSDVDNFYQGKGYECEGSIFIVKPQPTVK